MTKNAMISIDFWDTLVIAETGGAERREIRFEAVREIAKDYIQNLPPDQVEAASKQASDEFYRIWFSKQETPTTTKLINKILYHLGVPATNKELQFLVSKFEESLLESPPELFPGVKETLPKLHQNYKLALISDTMYSPGEVIRKYLEQRELLDYFDEFVFSDEVGYSKPNVKAFTATLDKLECDADQSFHIGDRLNTDIRGANEAGMTTILYTGNTKKQHKENDDIQPDYTLASWENIFEILEGPEDQA